MSGDGEFGNEAMIENNICEQANKLVEQKGNAAGNQPNGGSKERDQHHAELGGFGQTSVADRRAGCRKCRRMIAIAGSICFDCGMFPLTSDIDYFDLLRLAEPRL